MVQILIGMEQSTFTRSIAIYQAPKVVFICSSKNIWCHNCNWTFYLVEVVKTNVILHDPA